MRKWALVFVHAFLVLLTPVVARATLCRNVAEPVGSPIEDVPENACDSPQLVAPSSIPTPTGGNAQPSTRFQRGTTAAPGSIDPVQDDGELIHSETDISLPARGFPFELTRYYRSRVRYKGPLGWNWTFSDDRRLYWIKVGDCGFRIDYHDGHFGQYQFHFASRDAKKIIYSSDPGVGLSLEYRFATKEYVVRDASLIEQSFQGPAFDGKDAKSAPFTELRTLSQLRDPLGNQQTFEWSNDRQDDEPQPRIMQVTDTVGRVLHFNYTTVVRPNELGHPVTENFLSCVSFDTTCASPLFSYRVATAGTSVPQDPHCPIVNATERHPVHADSDNFGELLSAVDDTGTGFTYSYSDCAHDGLHFDERNPRNTQGLAQVEAGCTSLCSSNTPGTCTNADICHASPTRCSQLQSDARDRCPTVCAEFCGPFDPGCIFTCIPPCWAHVDSDAEHCRANFRARAPYCDKSPVAACIVACIEPHVEGGAYAFGAKRDSNHNLVTITDTQGQRLLKNEYGEDNHLADFDRVKSQWLGASDDDSAKVTFEYHFLDLEKQIVNQGSIFVGQTEVTTLPSAIDTIHVVQLDNFSSIDVCPDGGLDICTAAPGIHPAPASDPQVPKLATVIKDIYGTYRTQYLDDKMRLLRSVTYRTGAESSPYETTNYNYRMSTTAAYTRLELHAAGDRAVYEFGDRGELLVNITTPAPGYDGDQSRRISLFTYDANTQLLTKALVTPTFTHSLLAITRDPLTSRILSRTEHVDDRAADDRITTYVYSFPPNSKWYIPSRITHPGGDQTANGQFNDLAGTAERVTTDENTAAAVAVETLHDDLGRVSKETHSVGAIPLRSTGYDYEGKTSRVHTSSQFDLLKPSGDKAPYTTTFDYQGTQYVHQVFTPDAWVQYIVDEYGNHTGEWITSNEPAQTVTHCYDRAPDGRLRQEMLPEGQLRSYRYDEAGRVIAIDEGFPDFAAPPEWAVDCYGNIDPAKEKRIERIKTAEFWPGGFPRDESDGSGVGVYFVTDGYGRPIITIDSTGNQRWQGYDPLGNVAWTAQYGPASGIRCRGCNLGVPPAYGFPASPWYSLQSMQEMQYDYVGRQTQQTRWKFTPGAVPAAPTKVSSGVIYRDKLNVVASVDEGGSITEVFYDGSSRPVARLFLQGLWSSVPLSQESARYYGNSVEWTMPSPTGSGTVTRTSKIDAFGTTLVQYNGDPQLGDVLVQQVTDVLGRVVERSGRGSGPDPSTLPRDQKTHYDSFGRVSFMETDVSHDGVRATTKNVYGWDRNGNLASFTDGNQNTINYTYDGADRLKKKTDALRRETRYDYEPGTSRLKVVTMPGGTTITNTYTSGLLTQQDVWGAADLANGEKTLTRTFTYDALGRIGTATVTGDFEFRTNGTTIRRSYDSLGTMISETEPFSPFAITRDYDPATRKLSLQWGDATISRTLDSLGRTAEIDLGGTLVARSHYPSGRGPADSIKYGNGVTTTFAWDALGRPKGFTASAGSQPPLVTMSLQLDANGSPLARRTVLAGRAARTEVFAIDNAGRLVAEGFGGGASIAALLEPLSNTDTAPLIAASPFQRTYALDGADNWSSVAHEGSTGTIAFSPDVTNAYTSVAGQRVKYDSLRNVMAYPADAPATETYAFDGAGQLIGAFSNGAATTFAYDALGRRVYENKGDAERYYVWDGGQILGVGSDPAHGESYQFFVRDGALVVAVASGGGKGPRTTLHASWDGSTVAASDATGNLVEAYAYSAYGETTILAPNGTERSASELGNPFLYQGQYYDARLGAYLMGAREYKPAWGRFLSADPAGISGGQNAYAFVNAKPLTFADPSGLEGEGKVPPAVLPIDTDVQYGPVNEVNEATATTEEFANCLAAGSSLCIATFKPDEVERRNAWIRIDPRWVVDGSGYAGGDAGATLGVLLANAINGGHWPNGSDFSTLVKSLDGVQSHPGSFLPPDILPGANAQARTKVSRGSSWLPRWTRAVTDDDRAEILRRQSGGCAACGVELTREPGPNQLHLDHSNPYATHGPIDPLDAQGLCRTCNLEKGSMSLADWIEEGVKIWFLTR